LDETKLPLTTHLAELRTRLFWILGAWTAATIAAWNFRDQIFGYLLKPATRALATLGHDAGPLQAIAPTEILFTHIKCALLAGFVISLPITFWHTWAFVAPGLYPNEKRTTLPFVLISTLLFVGGALFGHTFVFPIIYQFFASFSSSYVQAAWTMREVFSMNVQLILAFGVGFELPIVVYFLAAAGIAEPRALLRGTKYGVLVSFVVGAVLTPSPDIVSQFLLAGPLSVLYLLGVAAAFLFAPRRKPAAGEAPAKGLTTHGAP
jgi:sec-independent protein translocase protein TatC